MYLLSRRAKEAIKAGLAMAIAFGVGGIDSAKKWWALYGTPGISKREAARVSEDQTVSDN